MGVIWYDLKSVIENGSLNPVIHLICNEGNKYINNKNLNYK